MDCKKLFGINFSFKRKLYLVFLFMIFSSRIMAQDDLSNLLNDLEPKKREFVTATFKGTRLINFHTIETLGKRCLDFRISHHFGDLNGGPYQFFGMDGGASIRFALEYTYDGRLQGGLGRSSLEKTYDGFLKYRLIRQAIGKPIPISVTLVASMFYNTTKDPNIAQDGFDRYQYASNRMSYAYQIIIARKFSPSFSFQVAPVMVHFNLVDNIGDKNDMYALAFATRCKLTKRMAVTAEYAKRLTQFTTSQVYYDSAGLGLDIETGGHVFQVYVTNSLGQIENQFIPRTTSSWKNMGIKLGFNISRAFRI